MSKKTLQGRGEDSENFHRDDKITSWGNVASWYDDVVEREGSYQRDLILPNLLRLLDIKKGDNIADIACGQGFFSREFAKGGALVSGFDISPELIKIANLKSVNSGVSFFVSPADKLKTEDQKFNKATIVLALQDIENLNGVLVETGRVLKNGGQLFIVMNHPTFRIPKRSAWGFDEKNGIQYRRIDEYISESRIKINVNPGKEKSAVTNYFHRPLQTYFKAFEKAGFVVARLEEWVSNRESESGPRAQAENKARREFPLFLAMVLRK